MVGRGVVAATAALPAEQRLGIEWILEHPEAPFFVRADGALGRLERKAYANKLQTMRNRLPRPREGGIAHVLGK